jgi:hypothetical protein
VRAFGGSHLPAHRKSTTIPKHGLAFLPRRAAADAGRTEEGRAELQNVLDAPLDPAWAPEDREFKEKARRARETAR